MFRRLAAALLASVALAAPASADPGALDPGWGRGGVVLPPTDPQTGYDVSVLGLVARPDGGALAGVEQGNRTLSAGGRVGPLLGSPLTDLEGPGTIDAQGALVTLRASQSAQPPTTSVLRTDLAGLPDPRYGALGRVDLAEGPSALAGDGRVVVADRAVRGRIQLLDADGRLLPEPPGLGDDVTALAFDPTGGIVAALGGLSTAPSLVHLTAAGVRDGRDLRPVGLIVDRLLIGPATLLVAGRPQTSYPSGSRVVVMTRAGGQVSLRGVRPLAGDPAVYDDRGRLVLASGYDERLVRFAAHGTGAPRVLRDRLPFGHFGGRPRAIAIDTRGRLLVGGNRRTTSGTDPDLAGYRDDIASVVPIVVALEGGDRRIALSRHGSRLEVRCLEAAPTGCRGSLTGTAAGRHSWRRTVALRSGRRASLLLPTRLRRARQAQVRARVLDGAGHVATASLVLHRRAG